MLKCAEEASLWEAFMYLDYKAAEQRDQYNAQKKAIEKAKLQSKIKR